MASIRKSRESRRETVLTADQRQLILNEASDCEFRDLLTAAEETGVRPQEIRTVEARHVDQKNGLWVFPAEEHKTGGKIGKPRIVFLTPTVLEITLRLVKQHPSGLLFRNSQGNPWTANAIRIRCRFRRLRSRLSDELPKDLCAYVYRHTFATDALENGVDPITVAELMGHRDATMVCRVYQHLGKRMQHMKDSARRATGRNASSQDP